MQNINVYAAIAAWKKDKAGLCPIHISIDIDGKRAGFPSLKKRIKADDWDNAGRRVKASHLNAAHYNALIQLKIAEYNGIITKMQLKEQAITKALVKKFLSGGNNSNQDFYAFCRQQIGIIDYKESTRKNYRGEITKLEKYAPVLQFSDITYQWLQGYENYMRTKLNNQGNTCWKSFKFMNTMMSLAIKVGGIIDKNPFKEYNRGKYKQGIPTFLEWDEVKLVHEFVTTKPMNEAVRLSGYYFLLSCYTGLRFGDSVSFDYATKVTEDSTGKRIVLYATKNGEIVSIAFNRFIEEITNYLRDKATTISNQDFNDNLKIIQGIADIAKDISSHTGRHSFGMRCAELDISIERTQKLLGHLQQKSTSIYYRVKNTSLDSSMQKWE